MTDRNDKAGVSVSVLQEAWAMLVRVVGAIAGAAGLTFGVGFVVVNVSLLKHGVYEGALVRERYVAAGLSYMFLLVGAIIIALAAYSLARKLVGRGLPLFRVEVTLALAAGMNYLLAVVMWEFKGPFSFSRPLFIWALASGCSGLLILFADSMRWMVDASAQTLGEPESIATLFRKRAQSPARQTSLGIFFLVLLVIYGQYVYDTLPAAFGGGLPVVVQFAGDEKNMTLLAAMGVPLENATTSGQLEFIGQTESRYFIFVRQTTWERSLTTGKTRVTSRRTALAFDKELVQGIRYYPWEYHLSDDFAAVTHVQQGYKLANQEFYDGAIDEYTKAISRLPDYPLALFRRGQAYLVKARNTLDEQERASLADQAVNDLAKASGLSPGEASYWYDLAQAQALAGQHRTAIKTLSQAIERVPAYSDMARDEPLFEALQVRENLDFGFEVAVFGDVVEGARAYAAQGQDRYAAAQEADDEQVRGEALTEATLAYIRAISLTVTVELPLERASYQFALAVIYQDQEKSDLALTQLEQAVEAAPENESYRLRLADAYTAQGRWEDAARGYEAVLARNDQNVNAWLGKGNVLSQQGDYRQAADAYQRASELAPKEVRALYGLGVARLEFDPAEAEEPFRQAVTLDPNRVAVIRQDLQSAELEDEVYARLEAVLWAAEAALQGDAALEAEDLAQAIEAYRIAVETDPDNTAYRIKLGDTYRKQGNTGAVEAYAEAEIQYRRAIEQVPDDASYHFRLAKTYAAQEENADALTEFDTAIRLASDVAIYYADRAQLYFKLDRPDDAIQDTQKAISLDLNNYLYHGQLGRFYRDQKRYDEAIKALTSATEMNSQYALGFYYLGLVHLERNDAGAARTAFADCVEVADESQRRLCEEQLTPLTTPTP